MAKDGWELDHGQQALLEDKIRVACFFFVRRRCVAICWVEDGMDSQIPLYCISTKTSSGLTLSSTIGVRVKSALGSLTTRAKVSIFVLAIG